jgi:hypothetical protein
MVHSRVSVAFSRFIKTQLRSWFNAVKLCFFINKTVCNGTSVQDSQQNYYLPWGIINTSPNPQVGVPPLVVCSLLLVQYIRSYPPYWRPFLHPQPEDTPCRSDKELHYLYSSPNIVRVIKSKIMRWAGHVARMGEKRGIYRFLVGKLRERDTWEIQA